MYNNMGKKLKGRWLDEPNEDDYAAAESFLTLIYDKESTGSFLKKLKKAEVLQFEAKDIFRAFLKLESTIRFVQLNRRQFGF